jgi:hypothetical protein
MDMGRIPRPMHARPLNLPRSPHPRAGPHRLLIPAAAGPASMDAADTPPGRRGGGPSTSTSSSMSLLPRASAPLPLIPACRFQERAASYPSLDRPAYGRSAWSSGTANAPSRRRGGRPAPRLLSALGVWDLHGRTHTRGRYPPNAAPPVVAADTPPGDGERRPPPPFLCGASCARGAHAREIKGGYGRERAASTCVDSSSRVRALALLPCLHSRTTSRPSPPRAHLPSTSFPFVPVVRTYTGHERARWISRLIHARFSVHRREGGRR